MSKRIILRNIIATFVLQFVTILNGLIVPKIFITEFGSEANGLITSINQFLNYVTLLEGGLSSVVLASLYKPLRENDQNKISGIFNATQRFFKQIGVIYIVYAVLIAILFPRFVETKFSNSYVFVLVIVLAVNLFVQYFFSITYQILLRASQRVYLVSMTKAVIMLLNIVLVVFLSKKFADIVFIKAASAIVLFLQPIFFCLYVKKKYDIDKSVPKDNEALKQRWDGFGHTLAYFINTNISIIMLTAFSTLSIVSVYSVYIMITNAIRNLVVSVASAIVPSLGNVMANECKKESNEAFDLYEFGIGFLTTLLFTCGIVLVVPFVKLYTQNVTDVDYIQPAFAVVLMLAEMIYCFREPYINASYAAGHFKETTKFAYIEVALNVVISFALVHKYNLLGVSIGLLVAMTFRMVAHVVYLKKNILQRPLKRFFEILLSLFSVTAFVVILSGLILPLREISNYLQWFLYAAFIFIVTFLLIFIVSLLNFKAELKKIVGNKLSRKNPH